MYTWKLIAFSIYVLMYQTQSRYGMIYSLFNSEPDRSGSAYTITICNKVPSTVTSTTTESFSCSRATVVSIAPGTTLAISSANQNDESKDTGSVITAYVDVTLTKSSSDIQIMTKTTGTSKCKQTSTFPFLDDEDLLDISDIPYENFFTKFGKDGIAMATSTSVITVTSTTTSVSTVNSPYYSNANFSPQFNPYYYHPQTIDYSIMHPQNQYHYNNYHQSYHLPQYPYDTPHNTLTFIQDEDEDAVYYTYYPSLSSDTVTTVTTHIGGSSTSNSSTSSMLVTTVSSLNTTTENQYINTTLLETIGFVTRTKVIPTTTQAITYVDVPTLVTITTLVSIPTMMTFPTTQTVTTSIPVTVPSGFISHGDDAYTIWKKKHKLFIQSGGTEVEWKKLFLISMGIEWKDYVQQSIKEDLDVIDLPRIGCKCKTNGLDILDLYPEPSPLEYKKRYAQALKKKFRQQLLQSYYQSLPSTLAANSSLYPMIPISTTYDTLTAPRREKMSFTSCPTSTSTTHNETFTGNTTVSNITTTTGLNGSTRLNWNFYQKMRGINETSEINSGTVHNSCFNDTVWIPSTPYDAYSLMSSCNGTRSLAFGYNDVSSKVDLHSTMSILKGLIDGVVTIAQLLQVPCMTQALRTVLILLGRYCPLCYDEHGQKLYHFDFLYNDFLKGQHVGNVEVDRPMLAAIYSQLTSGTNCCPNSVAEQYYRDENGEIHSPYCCK